MNDEVNLPLRTKDFARRIIRLYCALPKGNTVAQVLGKQVLRSGTSVGANYREAHRAHETLYWLELLIEENVLPGKRFQLLATEADELIAIFTAISKRAKANA